MTACPWVKLAPVDRGWDRRSSAVVVGDFDLGPDRDNDFEAAIAGQGRSRHRRRRRRHRSRRRRRRRRRSRRLRHRRRCVRLRRRRHRRRGPGRPFRRSRSSRTASPPPSMESPGTATCIAAGGFSHLLRRPRHRCRRFLLPCRRRHRHPAATISRVSSGSIRRRAARFERRRRRPPPPPPADPPPLNPPAPPAACGFTVAADLDVERLTRGDADGPPTTTADFATRSAGRFPPLRRSRRA